jgi:hypothetical protein
MVKKMLPKSARPPVVHEIPIQVLPPKPKSSSKLTMGLPEFSKTGELQPSSSTKCKFDYSLKSFKTDKFIYATAPLDATDDGDEPYEPFDDDDDSLSYAPTQTAAKPETNDDLESEMEILNRAIELRQLEIQSLAQQKAMELNEEQATRIFENITVPHDLSEILSKISSNKTNEMMDVDDNDDDEYVPSSMPNVDYHASASSASYSAMSQTAPIANEHLDIDERIAMFQGMQTAPVMEDQAPSRLAHMSDADLMKLVPDGALPAPPAPIISVDRTAIPGLEDDDYEMN